MLNGPSGKMKAKAKVKVPSSGNGIHIDQFGREKLVYTMAVVSFLFFLAPHIDGSLRFIIKLDGKSEERKG